MGVLKEFDIEEWKRMSANQGLQLVEVEPKITPEDILHLEWIYSRMHFIHKENPNYDYMRKFDSIIKKLKHDNI
jgi:hypothetical protein